VVSLRVQRVGPHAGVALAPRPEAHVAWHVADGSTTGRLEVSLGSAATINTIPVSDTPTVVNILWGDFTAGSPDVSVATPAEITFISWTLAWTAGGTPYPVDLVIDDLSFIP
jgi:hypothetical protein